MNLPLTFNLDIIKMCSKNVLKTNSNMRITTHYRHFFKTRILQLYNVMLTITIYHPMNLQFDKISLKRHQNATCNFNAVDIV